MYSQSASNEVFLNAIRTCLPLGWKDKLRGRRELVYGIRSIATNAEYNGEIKVEERFLIYQATSRVSEILHRVGSLCAARVFHRNEIETGGRAAWTFDCTQIWGFFVSVAFGSV